MPEIKEILLFLGGVFVSMGGILLILSGLCFVGILEAKFNPESIDWREPD